MKHCQNCQGVPGTDVMGRRREKMNHCIAVGAEIMVLTSGAFTLKEIQEEYYLLA